MGDSDIVYQHVSTIAQHAATSHTHHIIAHRLAFVGRVPSLEADANVFAGHRNRYCCHRPGHGR